MERKFRRIGDLKHRIFAGTCAGLAYFIGAPVWITRLICFIMFLSFETSFLFTYLLFWVILPKWEQTPSDFDKITGD